MVTTRRTTLILAFTLLVSILQTEGLPKNAVTGNKQPVIAKRQTLYDHQCKTGPQFNVPVERSGVAAKDFLYLNYNDRVKCSGRITSLEMCFYPDYESSAPLSISLLVTRPQGSNYIVLDSLEVQANAYVERDDITTTDSTICQNITVSSTLMVNEGDLIGFACRNGIRVAFGIFPNQNGRINAGIVQPVFGLETIAMDQLRPNSRDDNEVPFLRALIQGMDESNPTSASDNCNGEDGVDVGGGDIIPELNTDNIYNTTFTSFVVATIVAIIIIFILILVICGMGMSMLKMKYECVCNIIRCCRGKKTKKKGLVRRIINV